ncbi:MAG TPA: abortive phage infection protein [Paenibacillus sp.]|uniref:AIPR family protein n=1 Tax=Paenibacillus TaxID=44249 RepID=UPI000BA0044B|nr:MULTISPECIES: AIPR family protein [Paenibacillus]OZQ60635.1 abortive phage infection protein [Paenibacillus taichungensis]HBU80988.1 abortive phage infection protein [Paenibacillus sp.]
MISLEEFHQDFLQSILVDAESRGLMRSQAFFENTCETLASIGELTIDYTAAEYTKTGIEVHGYDYDNTREMLTVLVHQFFQEDHIETLNKTHIITKFKRLRAFVQKSLRGFHKEMEETSDAYSMAYNIYYYAQMKKINKIKLIVLTDGKMTRTLSELPSERIDDIPADLRVIDIEYIYKINLSEYTDNNFEVNVRLPCLEIPTSAEEYQSYLSFLTGDDLVSIYDQFGQKLFEQNVRTFLQFKGGVNKGIRNTIEYNPELFFAYNNGITATASEVEFDEQGNISKIIDFQIVNGAQTTSSIYAAKKNSKLDVSKVSVQMKLSVVKEKERQYDFVSKVSEYANTQNKVNKSDFFSNNPYHKEMKSNSQRVWAPSIGGAQRRTHWFYERVRGEYLNEQAYLTKAEKTKFQLENPKSQLIEKTFLSKSENSWLKKPDVVSKGAQYSFASFADHITDWLEEDNLAITESYYKDAVARIILFKNVEKMISNASWYDGGFRAQTVTYTIAYLSQLVEKTGSHFNFNLIWEEQKLPKELVLIISAITKQVYDSITDPPGGSANIAQWCKKRECWERVKKLDLNIELDSSLLVEKEENKYIKREARKEKKLTSGIEVQIFVVNMQRQVWIKMLEHFKKYQSVSNVSRLQMDILERMALGSLGAPSEKQSKVLNLLYEKAVGEGIIS